MKFWVDAQLPPQLADWLATEFHIEAKSLRDLGLRDAADFEIFQQARHPGVILISKDSDLVDLVSRFGQPPQLLWVTCGNVTNRRLQSQCRPGRNESVGGRAGNRRNLLR